MNWIGVTEIVTGFVLKKKLDANMVNPNDLYPPYNEIIPLVRDGMELPDIVTKVGFSSVHIAIEACESVNGDMKPLEWLKALQKTAGMAQAAVKLEKAAKDLKEGRDVDLGTALMAVSMIDNNYRSWTPMTEVVLEDTVWVKTGWKPLDECLGGIVKAGLTVIGASPGVGKTTLLLKIAGKMAAKYKKQKIALFTLEMTMAQLAARMLESDADIEEDVRSRILLNDFSFTIDEAYAEATRLAAQEKLSMIGIDFADLMVEGEQSEAVMGAIYRGLSMLAKKTGIPVILISQLNRATYTGGIPKINNLRYSGMAEAMSALILLIYNPNNILAEFAGTPELQAVEGRGYVIAGKSRFGFKKGGPGAMQVEWNGLGGWGDDLKGWFDLKT